MQFSEKLKMSRALFPTNLWSISYVQADLRLAKFKGLLIKIKVIKGFLDK